MKDDDDDDDDDHYDSSDDADDDSNVENDDDDGHGDSTDDDDDDDKISIKLMYMMMIRMITNVSILNITIIINHQYANITLMLVCNISSDLFFFAFKTDATAPMRWAECCEAEAFWIS